MIRPEAQVAIGFGVLVVAGVAWWFLSATPPAPVDPLPLRPDGLEPVEQPIVGEMSDAQRGKLLDELEAYEAARYGATEAARRRHLREQMLEAKTRKAPQTP